MEAQGASVTIADARFAKPLDHALIRDLVRNHRAVVTVEQGAQGGFGAMVLHMLANDGLLDGGCQLRSARCDVCRRGADRRGYCSNGFASGRHDAITGECSV